MRPATFLRHAPGVRLPARGIFAVGQAHWEIRDEVEYHRTRAEDILVADDNEEALIHNVHQHIAGATRRMFLVRRSGP